MNDPSICTICGRPLGVEADPVSGNCGGDCWGCIGYLEARMGGEPDENVSIGFVAKETKWGWREADGTPKEQSFFLDGGPRHMQVRWLHSSPNDPIELWSEVDARREEIRKVELWADGRVGYAFGEVEAGGTRLGDGPIPSLDKIAADPEFEPQAVSQSDFEECWATHVG